MKPILQTTLLCFFIIFSSYQVVRAESVFHTTKNDTVTFTRIDFFNKLAQAAGLDPLNEQIDTDGRYIRLWSPFALTYGAQFLNIQIKGEHRQAQWIVGWSAWGDEERRKRMADRWSCKTKINRIQIDGGVIAACTLKIADDSEILHIENELNEANFFELISQPLEKWAQLDGSSLHVELLDSTGYQFVSFMHYHLNNHPDKINMNKIRELVFEWRNESDE